MALLPIIVAPDPRLKIKARPVAKVDARIRKLMDDMLETMYAAPGIGLAAPQVGEGVRVLVLDVAREGEPRAQTGCVRDHSGEPPGQGADTIMVCIFQLTVDFSTQVLITSDAWSGRSRN